jgi:IclR family KDG regulon transcriptional repressor
MTQFTSATITDAVSMRKTLRTARDCGVAVSRGERSAGIGAIAVPVFDGARNVAALGIAYPLALVSESKVSDYTALLHTRAAALSLRLGAESYPFQPQAQVRDDFVMHTMEKS